MDIPYAENRPLRRITLPEAYRDPEFVKWLDDMATKDEQGSLATWYAGGEISQEHADIFMTMETIRVAPNAWADLVRDPESFLGDGSNSDMPPRWFRAICLSLGPGYNGLVWLANDPDWSGP